MVGESLAINDRDLDVVRRRSCKLLELFNAGLDNFAADGTA
jgi:hypothetical protein